MAANFACWLLLFLNLVEEKPSNVRAPTIVRLASMKSQRFLFSTCTVTLLSVRQREPHHEQQLREYVADPMFTILGGTPKEERGRNVANFVLVFNGEAITRRVLEICN